METFKTFFLWTWRVSITILVVILFATMGAAFDKTDRLANWIEAVHTGLVETQDQVDRITTNL